MTKGIDFEPISTDKKLNILIVHARWNKGIISELLNGALSTLSHHNVTVHSVPGSFELPMGIQLHLKKNPVYDACIAIGVLIKGSTMHFEYISSAVSEGLMNVGLSFNTPVIFGVLTCLTEEQAKERAGLSSKGHNHGIDWGYSAIEMGLLKNAWLFLFF